MMRDLEGPLIPMTKQHKQVQKRKVQYIAQHYLLLELVLAAGALSLRGSMDYYPIMWSAYEQYCRMGGASEMACKMILDVANLSKYGHWVDPHFNCTPSSFCVLKLTCFHQLPAIDLTL